MAKAIGVTQGAISHVLTGRRKPGRELLAAIAKHPAVNPTWLWTGEGEAILADVLAPASGELALPVARQLFDGLPQHNTEMLEPHLFAVTQRLFRISRYWLVVSEQHPLTHDSDLRIAPGDSLLIEPDSSRWPTDLRGFPCIIRVGHRGKKNLSLVKSLSCTRGEGTTKDFCCYAGKSDDADSQSERYQKSIVLDKELFGTEPIAEKATVVAVAIYRCGGFSR